MTTPPEIVQPWNAVADTFAAQNGATWTLAVSPNGRVEVLRNGTSLGTYAFSTSGLRSASLLVFGRNLNSPGQNAAVRTLRFDASICDVPGAWDTRSPLAVSDEVSIELGYKVRMQTKTDLGDAFKPDAGHAVVVKMVEEIGRLGRKAGAGFYDYPADGAKRLWPGLAHQS